LIHFYKRLNYVTWNERCEFKRLKAMKE